MQLPSIHMTTDGFKADGSSPKLLGALLEEFESEVVARVGPIGERALPPADAEEVRAAFAVFGLTPPSELVTLYGWHNGLPYGAGDVFPTFPFVKFELALDRYKTYQRVLEEEMAHTGLPQGELSFGAGPGWVPLFPGQYALAIDCAGPPTEAPRVRATSLEFDEADPVGSGQVVSLCTLITWWIEGVRAGAHHWVPDENRWETDDEKLPALQRQSRVN